MQPIRAPIELAHRILHDRDETLPRLGVLPVARLHAITGGAFVPTELPEHAPPQALAADPVAFPRRDLLRVEADHLLPVVIIRPARDNLIVLENIRSRERQRAVIIGALLPATGPKAVVRRAGAVCVHEAPAVEGHADDNLVAGDALANVPVDRLRDAELAPKQVRLVTRDFVPRTGYKVRSRSV